MNNQSDDTIWDVNYLKPLSLYRISCKCVAKNYGHFNMEMKIFHSDIYIDVLCSLYHQNLHLDLYNELCLFQNLKKALKSCLKKSYVYRLFQACMDLSFNISIQKPSSLVAADIVRLLDCKTVSCREKVDWNLLVEAFEVCEFLSNSGWFEDAEIIATEIKSYLLKIEDLGHRNSMLLSCYQKLLKVQNGYCKFKPAAETFCEASKFISSLPADSGKGKLASLYSQISVMYILQSDYQNAYDWGVKAVECIDRSTPLATVCDVLRQTAKACVQKREFEKAQALIKQAFSIAKKLKPVNSIMYADVLIDYGFYFLCVDNLDPAIEMYKTALESRINIFGPSSINLPLAIALEDSAYASYVHNYSAGLFLESRHYCENSIRILERLIPADHFLFASCKRVKALILEELAIDSVDKAIECMYLEEAHQLHSEALLLSVEAFGEMNIQTAKHYGNLGRLFQSMKRFEEAEDMHLKAIEIKETILGPEDYEVALSVGHLASLYNYDLCKFESAELLYLRSIEIGKKLFGEAYSGLEYDYQGLLRVYANTANTAKQLEYFFILSNWKDLREEMRNAERLSPFNQCSEPLDIGQTLSSFKSLFD